MSNKHILLIQILILMLLEANTYAILELSEQDQALVDISFFIKFKKPCKKQLHMFEKQNATRGRGEVRLYQ